jgi:hypothetical protein
MAWRGALILMREAARGFQEGRHHRQPGLRSDAGCSMSAKSLAKYPRGSILNDILHPLIAAGAGASAPRW